jgi:hypothetical protein
MKYMVQWDEIVTMCLVVDADSIDDAHAAFHNEYPYTDFTLSTDSMLLPDTISIDEWVDKNVES